MGMISDGQAVISFPVAKVSVASFATTAAREKGVTRVTVALEVRDPWELADLLRDLAEVRAATPSQRFKL